MSTATERWAAWVAGLEREAIPDRVARLAASQLLGHLGALAAGAQHPLGERLVGALGAPFDGDPRQTAQACAALTMILDFDDTMYAGHVSHSTVGTALAYAAGCGLDGPELLTTIVAANEVAARLTAAATLGHLRGQTATHTHLAGAVAARGCAERCDADRLVDAWGIALSLPHWPVERGFFSGDAKALVAALPIGEALTAYDAAVAGLRGPADIVEHAAGFLQRFAILPLVEATGGLGERWHTETLSIKVHPGCAYIDGAVDAAIALHPRVVDRIDQIEEVVVEASLFTVGMEARSSPHLEGPRSSVSGITFSVPFNVATALRRGRLTPDDLGPDAVADVATWALARRVAVRQSDELSLRALLATAPLGAALRTAGEPAAAWMARALGGTPETYAELLRGGLEPGFENAEKAMGAIVTVRLSNGETLSERVDIPEGAAGAEMRRHHRQLALGKFRESAVPWMGAASAQEVVDVVEGIDTATVEDVVRLTVLLRAPFSSSPPRR